MFKPALDTRELADLFPEDGLAVNSVCQICGGSGWELVEQVVNGVMEKRAKRCRCRKPGEQSAALPRPVKLDQVKVTTVATDFKSLAAGDDDHDDEVH